MNASFPVAADLRTAGPSKEENGSIRNPTKDAQGLTLDALSVVQPGRRAVSPSARYRCLPARAETAGAIGGAARGAENVLLVASLPNDALAPGRGDRHRPERSR